MPLRRSTYRLHDHISKQAQKEYLKEGDNQKTHERHHERHILYLLELKIIFVTWKALKKFEIEGVRMVSFLNFDNESTSTNA